MAWTAPRTWTPGEVATAAMLNTHVRDNLLHGAVKQVVRREYEIASVGYATTSTTFVDVDATNLKADITLLGGNGTVLAWCTFAGASSINTYSYFDLVLGASRSYTSASGFQLWNNIGNEYMPPIPLVGLWTGVAAGLQTIKLQYRAFSGASAFVSRTPNGTFRSSTVQFVLMEI